MRMPALALVATIAPAALVACKAAPHPFPDDDRIPSSPVRVTFRPPEGTSIVERLETIRREGPEAGREVQSVHATLTSTFERSGEGWILTQQLSDVRAERGGAAVQSPFLDLMTRFPIRLRLAKDGAFVQLANAEEAQAA